MNRVIASLIFCLVALASASPCYAGESRPLSPEVVREKLIKARADLNRLDLAISESEIDSAAMSDLMPDDEYVGGTFFEENISVSKDRLQKMKQERTRLANAMTYYERLYGFGPEIYSAQPYARQQNFGAVQAYR